VFGLSSLSIKHGYCYPCEAGCEGLPFKHWVMHSPKPIRSIRPKKIANLRDERVAIGAPLLRK
jgi:hypothetical protein